MSFAGQGARIFVAVRRWPAGHWGGAFIASGGAVLGIPAIPMFSSEQSWYGLWHVLWCFCAFLALLSVTGLLRPFEHLSIFVACTRARCAAGRRIRRLLHHLLRTEVLKTQIHTAPFDLAQSTIKSYFKGAWSVDRLSKNERPLLPGNFEAYANCVQEVMARVDHLIDEDIIQKATVYTHFARTIFEWYNPFLRIVRNGNGPPALVSYTVEWWEQYKNFMHRYKLPQNGRNILVYRLIAHPARISTALGEIIELGDQTTFAQRYFVPERKTDIFTMPPDVSDFIAKYGREAVADQYRLFQLIRTEKALYGNGLDKIARIHCIAEPPNLGADSHDWMSLVADFESAHHTNAFRADETYDLGGCYYAYTSGNGLLLNAFADVFVVEMDRNHMGETIKEYFGVALQMDGFNDAEGIKILQTAESTRFTASFIRELHKASPTFCFAESRAGNSMPPSEKAAE
jgi:hypothetical protein